MITAHVAKTIDFPTPRQAAPRPARPASWLARVGQRMRRRQQADTTCLIH